MAAAQGPAAPPAKHPGRLRQWWLDRSVQAKALTVLAVPLIALFGTTSASLVLEHDERAGRATSLKAFTLISTGNQILTDAINAETGVRGYVATGNSVFLTPYNLALARFGADRKAYSSAASSWGVVKQQQVVDATATKVLADLSGLRLAASHGASPSSLTSSLMADKADVDRLRNQIVGLNKLPETQLLAGRHATDSLEREIVVLDIAGIVLGVVAVLAGIALFTFGISRRVDAAAANADRLGQGLPLQPADRSRDELGRLACALGRAAQLLDSRAADLTAARDEAVRATQAKTAFLSSTSHELRTPLNSILGFTQLLEMSELSEEDQDSVQRILVAGRHLLALINELIDIARIESGDLSLSLESVAIAPLIEEAAQLMGPLAAERSVRIDCACRRPKLAACADRQRFSQILVNLISNAIKYNKLGGLITITCNEASPDSVSVTITDTGRGIAPDDLERIFTPFERLGAETAMIEGTGIGLPLAKGLAEAMGGGLTATSALETGSAFTVSLPRAPDVETDEGELPGSPDTESTQPLPTRRAARASLWVLYIEDNPANVEVVARYLRNRRHAHLAAYPSGHEGYEYAAANRPDVILLDLHLQDAHGEQALIQLKGDPVTADIPVVVLSADASPGMIKRLIAAGAFAYLTKPLDLNELGAILDSLPAPTGTAAPGHSVPPQARSPEDRITGRDQPPEVRL